MMSIMKGIFNGWLLLLLLSSFLAIVFLRGTPEFLQIHKLAKHRPSVSVDVLRTTTSNLGRQPSHYLFFRYQEKEHSLRISQPFFAEVKEKKSTDLIHSSEYPDLFLPPDYDFNSQFTDNIILIALFILTALISIFQMFKKRSD